MIGDFARNQVLREAVREYILQVFKDETVEKVFNREDVSHIADANELVDKAFGQMEAEFEIEKDINQINEAR